MEGGSLHYFDGDFGKYTSLSFTVGMAVSTRDLSGWPVEKMPLETFQKGSGTVTCVNMYGSRKNII